MNQPIADTASRRSFLKLAAASAAAASLSGPLGALAMGVARVAGPVVREAGSANGASAARVVIVATGPPRVTELIVGGPGFR